LSIELLFEVFQTDFGEDLVGIVDKQFRRIAGRDEQAMVGFIERHRILNMRSRYRLRPSPHPFGLRRAIPQREVSGGA
jgi:hypothetical protein